MNSELKTRMPMPMPMPPSAARITDALQPAPVDVSYGEGGYSHVESHDPLHGSVCADICASHINSRLYYAATYRYRAADDYNGSFIRQLDEKGIAESPFASFNDYLSNQTFTPTQLVEDPDNKKLLCLGRLSTGNSFTMRLWRFDADGSLDQDFASKGYIDSEELMLGAGAILQLTSHAHGYKLIATKDGRPFLIALDDKGELKRGFGSDGFVDLDAALKYPLSTGAGFALAAFGQNVLVTIVAVDSEHDFSLLASFNDVGVLDTGFADQGVFKAQDGTYHYGLSIHEPAMVITLPGGHSDDYVTMYPELLRLSADGKPLAEFNGGKPVRFDTPGGWHYMHEVNGRLMGYGSFYSHNRAVCYALEGNLDTRFVFPDGFGELGVTPYMDGFRPTIEASVAFVPDSQRLLVAGRIFRDNQKGANAVIAAISYQAGLGERPQG
ncbi:hypothetical protein NJH54_07160 [Pseudomonas asiatica]|uniref:hypothetical protein n=1 Tax=Pseudomonas asiatica TaxID=2219225 RepID=UPI00209B7A77|nr:hypothetical protein [Pseudomonas asiatica]MCO7524287.1 hypothetical protein [Pseudomonas asiatica]